MQSFTWYTMKKLMICPEIHAVWSDQKERGINYKTEGRRNEISSEGGGLIEHRRRELPGVSVGMPPQKIF